MILISLKPRELLLWGDKLCNCFFVIILEIPKYGPISVKFDQMVLSVVPYFMIIHRMGYPYGAKNLKIATYRHCWQ